MPLNGKRVSVVGATGMGGWAVVRRLLAEFPDASIRAGRFSRAAPRESDPRVEWVRADLRLKSDARRAVKGCDCAVLAAASSAGSRGMAAEPWRATDDNAIMNTQILEACHFEGVARVLFVSSATVYQEFEGAVKEHELDLNQDPHPAYLGVGWSTRFAEKLCQFWNCRTGMETLVARSANIFGARASFDPERSNVVPALIRKAVDRTDPFDVWGRPDVARDLIYVDDFAGAIVALLAAREISHDVFNVGTGVGATVGDIVHWALDAAGHQPASIQWTSDAPPTIQARLLDCSKIQDAVGWWPEHTVQEGIRKTMEWWIENRDTWTK